LNKFENKYANGSRSIIIKDKECIKDFYVKNVFLMRKSSVQPNNQLLDLIDYNIERYENMNIQTEK
jgi:hypothetical protein